VGKTVTLESMTQNNPDFHCFSPYDCHDGGVPCLCLPHVKMS